MATSPSAVADGFVERSFPTRGIVVALTGVFMPILDFFIVNVAVPSMQRKLWASSGEVELVIAGYAVTYAALLITGGRLGDRLGLRTAFVLGMTFFTLASAICALTPTATVLIVARAFQGVAAAVLFPQVLSLIQTMVAADQRPRAMAFYGVALGLAAAVGQLLGGALISLNLAGWSWRWCFLINLPIGLVTIQAARRELPPPERRPAQIDAGGAFLVVVGLGCLVFALTEGRSLGWPAWSFILLVLAAAALLTFPRYERRVAQRGRDPLVPAGLLRERGFLAGLLCVFTFYLGMSSFFFILALQLQRGQELSPVESGLVFTPLALGFFAASLCARHLIARYGYRPLYGGCLVLVIAFGAEYLLVSADPSHIAALPFSAMLTLNGIGQGLVMAPLIGQVVARVSSRAAAVASGLLATTQQVSGAIGVALIGIVFFAVAGNAAADPIAISHGFQASLAGLAAAALAALVSLRRLEQIGGGPKHASVTDHL